MDLYPFFLCKRMTGRSPLRGGRPRIKRKGVIQ
mgnify:CR=1 FL=1